MVKAEAPFPLRGTLVWLTPEQGRATGPPPVSAEWDYAQVAFVPPETVDTGLASFVVRGFEEGAWRSEAEGRWLIVDNEGNQHVEPGSVVVVCEGRQVVAYFHADRVIAEDSAG